MTANINQLNNQPNIIEAPEVQEVNQEINQQGGNRLSPEAIKANEETKELLRDILAGYNQIPNPSDEVVAAKLSIQDRLAAMDGVVTLSEGELDALLNVKRYTDKDGQDPLPVALAHIDECQDYDSVKEQVDKAQDELVQAYDNKTIDAAELAKGFNTIKEKGDFVNARIEKNSIEQAISKVDLEKTDAPDFVTNLESLRTLIADAKFIDFHTKCELLDGLNNVLKASGKEEKPSESTSAFLRKREEMRAEQQKIMDALVNKNKEANPVNQPVNEIKVEGEIQEDNKVNVGNDIKKDQKIDVVNEIKTGQENNVVNDVKENKEVKVEIKDPENHQVPEPEKNNGDKGTELNAQIIENNDVK